MTNPACKINTFMVYTLETRDSRVKDETSPFTGDNIARSHNQIQVFQQLLKKDLIYFISRIYWFV